MRLHLITWEERDGSRNYRFCATQSERAVEAIIRLDREGNKILRDEPIDVPVETKAELVRFLNEFELAVAVKFDQVA